MHMTVLLVSSNTNNYTTGGPHTPGADTNTSTTTGLTVPIVERRSEA